MADDNSPMDYDEHNNTYALFITLTKWSIGIILLVLVLMAFFLL